MASVIIDANIGSILKMRGDDYSLNSEDLAFQHDGVDLELAVIIRCYYSRITSRAVTYQ